MKATGSRDGEGGGLSAFRVNSPEKQRKEEKNHVGELEVWRFRCSGSLWERPGWIRNENIRGTDHGRCSGEKVRETRLRCLDMNRGGMVEISGEDDEVGAGTGGLEEDQIYGCREGGHEEKRMEIDGDDSLRRP